MTKPQAVSIAIVIPVFNEQDQIKACLDSIVAQTVPPAEIIVVDNNCTDKTVVIAKRYGRVRVVPEKQQGITAARNTGFNAVRSEVIGRIDADCRLPVDWVERIQRFYADGQHAATAITGGCAFYNVPCPRLDQWITSQFVFRMNRLLVGYYLLWGSNMAVPTRLWQAVRDKVCQREDIHEDLDLAIHLHRTGYRIHYQADLIVWARMRRVFEDHRALWPYLKMWPRTLKAHRMRGWRGGYGGAVFLWCMQIVPRAARRIARAFGRRIPD